MLTKLLEIPETILDNFKEEVETLCNKDIIRQRIKNYVNHTKMYIKYEKEMNDQNQYNFENKKTSFKDKEIQVSEKINFKEEKKFQKKISLVIEEDEIENRKIEEELEKEFFEEDKDKLIREFKKNLNSISSLSDKKHENFFCSMSDISNNNKNREIKIFFDEDDFKKKNNNAISQEKLSVEEKKFKLVNNFLEEENSKFSKKKNTIEKSQEFEYPKNPNNKINLLNLKKKEKRLQFPKDEINPENNYELTDHNSDEESFEEIEFFYKNEKGETISNENGVSFLKHLSSSSSENFSKKDKKIKLFCRDKKIPEWAVDLEKVKKNHFEQLENNLHSKVFGIFSKYRNINLSAIFNIDKDDYAKRGDSVWNTPKSEGGQGSRILKNNEEVSRIVNGYQLVNDFN